MLLQEILLTLRKHSYTGYLSFSVCIPNNMTSKYIKQKLEVSQGNTDKPTVTMEDFNITLMIIDI